MENLDPKAWIAKARSDLKAAQYNFDGDHFDVAVFLCQQAAEKALKAVYIKQTRQLKKVHDLVLLAREVNLSQNLLEYCKEITTAYVYTRYPGFDEMSNIDEIAEKFLKYASEVIKWSEKQL